MLPRRTSPGRILTPNSLQQRAPNDSHQGQLSYSSRFHHTLIECMLSNVHLGSLLAQ
uniref:Uncharacterized protein n=1 Tax=Arundo donax TaxID=35708 RepID=A0A0A9DRR4_ARUDO